MSLEKAKELTEALYKDPELLEAFRKDREAAIAAKDYGCTLDELKEAIIMSRPLDDNELEAVSGGAGKNGSDGGCTWDYYKETCVDTVNHSGWCWSDDWCLVFDSHYNYVGPDAPPYAPYI